LEVKSLPRITRINADSNKALPQIIPIRNRRDRNRRRGRLCSTIVRDNGDHAQFLFQSAFIRVIRGKLLIFRSRRSPGLHKLPHERDGLGKRLFDLRERIGKVALNIEFRHQLIFGQDRHYQVCLDDLRAR
jgi:hypothetical protein